MTRVSRVIHTAQALVDEVLQVPMLPSAGSNIVVSDHARYAAGAVNILLAAVRQGATCVLAGSVGTGPNGHLVRATLAAEGVSLSAPPVADRDTGMCVVLLEPNGERTFLTTQGAERRITVDSLATAAPAPGDVICVSGYSLEGATQEPLLQWWLRLPDGVTVVVDPGAPFARLEDEVLTAALGRTDVYTGNAVEADTLARRALADAGAATGPEKLPIAESAATIAEMIPPGGVVVVRDGARGCVVHRNGRTTHHPGYPQRAVDTNGAGDAHTGVLVAELAAGSVWERAVERANVAGAIQVTRSGPGTAPTAAEIDRFLAEARAREPGTGQN